ncbi:MAG: hypothetical protein K9N48_07190 [Verrucomicrobia bacterium]|nr:hypothetical protein [Verrucomicrobiota bacterium]MCF7708339.1 hypothetical protein [Verrucomicrobiota bacterium]
MDELIDKPSGTRRHTPFLLILATNVRQMYRRLLSLRGQSKLLTSVIVLFITGYLTISFLLFSRGLDFVSSFPGLGTLLVERLVFLLFAFLFILLLFSNLVISYSNMFRNRETEFLFAMPLDHQTIFNWKFLESTVLASWAFVFLISPLLAAYGISFRAPWHFYLITPLLMAVFIVLPGVLGSWCAIGLARYLDRRSFQVAAVLIAVAGLVAAAIWLKPESTAEDILETRMLPLLDRLLSNTRFANFPFLPSFWLSSSVINWTDGAINTALFFVFVLLSYVCFLGFISFTSFGHGFFAAFSAVQSRSVSVSGWFNRILQSIKARMRAVDFLERMMGCLWWVRRDVRALVVKDMRMFWRDTTQWGQTIVLFGLLGLYILNLRNFSQQLSNPFWIHLVSFLNLGACSLNLATLTTRFVFPQFSQEGRRIWIVGMAPMGLERVVKTKFWFASVFSLVVTTGLIWLSCSMLKMPMDRTLFFVGAIAVMTFALNGLAVGTGVLYPNMREENPSKIVSGFGGTFCLVLTFLYILCSVAVLAVGSPWGRLPDVVKVSCWCVFLIISLLIGWLPMHLGIRRLARFEL